VFIGVPGIGLLGRQTGLAAVVSPFAPAGRPAKTDVFELGPKSLGGLVGERDPNPAADAFGVQLVLTAEVDDLQDIGGLRLSFHEWFLSIGGEWLTGPRWTGCKRKKPPVGCTGGCSFCLEIATQGEGGFVSGPGAWSRRDA